MVARSSCNVLRKIGQQEYDPDASEFRLQRETDEELPHAGFC
jgi:hypothetical protein